MAASVTGESSILVENKEGEDLKTPLPDWTKDDLKDVVVHGLVVSPPSVKVRTILHYYGVHWKNMFGPKKNSEYQKVPVLLVNGRQVNDSHIIVKSLAPILDGKTLTEELIQIEKELVTDGIQLSLSAEVLDSCSDICACGGLAGGAFGCFIRCISGCAYCCLNPRKTLTDLKPTAEYSKLLKEHLGENKYFHGEAPGIIDVAVWSVLNLHVEADTNAIRAMFELGDGWKEYYDRMRKQGNLASFSVPESFKN